MRGIIKLEDILLTIADLAEVGWADDENKDKAIANYSDCYIKRVRQLSKASGYGRGFNLEYVDWIAILDEISMAARGC